MADTVWSVLESLTKSEQRVVDLALAWTNDEVACELNVGPKTVEWILTRVYRKLSVRSRTERSLKVARIKSGDSPGWTAQR